MWLHEYVNPHNPLKHVCHFPKQYVKQYHYAVCPSYIYWLSLWDDIQCMLGILHCACCLSVMHCGYHWWIACVERWLSSVCHSSFMHVCLTSTSQYIPRIYASLLHLKYICYVTMTISPFHVTWIIASYNCDITQLKNTISWQLNFIWFNHIYKCYIKTHSGKSQWNVNQDIQFPVKKCKVKALYSRSIYQMPYAITVLCLPKSRLCVHSLYTTLQYIGRALHFFRLNLNMMVSQRIQ